MIEGSEALKAYWQEAIDFARVDTEMKEGGTYNSVYQNSARILKASTVKRATQASETFKAAYGGPWNVEVGGNI